MTRPMRVFGHNNNTNNNNSNDIARALFLEAATRNPLHSARPCAFANFGDLPCLSQPAKLVPQSFVEPRLNPTLFRSTAVPLPCRMSCTVPSLVSF